MKPFAWWNPDRDCWETDQGDLLSGLLDVFSETWPRSGMTRSGTAYELPILERRMDDSGSLLLLILPTPTTRDRGTQGENVGGGPELNTAFLVEHFSQLPP